MKLFKITCNLVLYTIMFVVLLAAIGTSVTRKPFLMTAIRSNSMYPFFQRGDMVLVQQLSKQEPIHIGDIILFKAEEGNMSSNGWIAHRVIEGNSSDGYITKGDANDYVDQDSTETTPIKREWIEGRVLTLHGQPLRIPLIGHLPLWVERFQANPFTFPTVAVILAIIIVISEIIGGSKKEKKRKNTKLELSLIYFFSGLVVSIIIATSMLAVSQHLNLVYEVSETNAGIIMGSHVGIIKVGDVVEYPLSDLNNKGFFPVVAAITSQDPQITFSQDKIELRPGEEIKTNMIVTAVTPGQYESTIHIGMFFPLLPKGIIYRLAEMNYWLALVIISLIPGLPVMLYPLFEGQLRKSAAREIRRRFRRIKQGMVFG